MLQKSHLSQKSTTVTPECNNPKQLAGKSKAHLSEKELNFIEIIFLGKLDKELRNNNIKETILLKLY